MRPRPSEYFSYFERYISLVPEDDVLPRLESQKDALRQSLGAIPAERAAFRYAEDKWNVRQVLGHIIDAERVFGYRALSIARGETRPLPLFDENSYAGAAGHENCQLAELVEEFCHLRSSHVWMLRHFDETAWDRIGSVGDHPTSTRALAFIMAGHLCHHARVLTERYQIAVIA
ncbi:MAG: DinB family protein [Acidobacteria bacterium]|nr:MAG: DinB family protein [Acidobacteriota bacterium]